MEDGIEKTIQQRDSFSNGKEKPTFKRCLSLWKLNFKNYIFYGVLMMILYSSVSYIWDTFGLEECPYKFAGGSPNIDGSCWCGWDTYCMCTPSLAIDCIVEYIDEEEKYIVIVERGDNPPGYAIVGGFVEVGESAEDAVKREVKEETGLDVSDLQQFHFYSDPHRDPRRHTASIVFIAQASGTIHAGDDAKRAVKLKISDLSAEMRSRIFAFDHEQILIDYITAKFTNDQLQWDQRSIWNTRHKQL